MRASAGSILTLTDCIGREDRSDCVMPCALLAFEERDRLLATIAAGSVSRDPPCLRGVVADAEDLDIRAAPARARVVNTLGPEIEVTIAETPALVARHRPSRGLGVGREHPALLRLSDELLTDEARPTRPRTPR